MKDLRQDPSGGVSTASAPSMSSSLLDKLVNQDPEAWRRLVRLYYPLVRTWCHRGGLQSEDAADVAQEVFRALAAGVGKFRPEDGQNSFRGWLYGITQRQLWAQRRKQKGQPAAAGGSEALQWFADVADGEDASSTSSILAPDDRRELLRRAMEILREGVADHTWQAFWRTAVEGHAPAQVAADLGITVNAVYIAKARMLSRLREEFGHLID